MIAPMVLIALLLLAVSPAFAADPEIDRLLRSPVGKDWVTNGGNLTNAVLDTQADRHHQRRAAQGCVDDAHEGLPSPGSSSSTGTV